MILVELCDCEQCIDSDTPCHFDCDLDAECPGCTEARLDREDIIFSIDFATGRR